MKFPLYDGVQGNPLPIGWVELSEDITGDLIQDAYILPLLLKQGSNFTISSFAFVQTPAVEAVTSS